ncbi:glycosyltransferase [bacterium]|nr:glycosyltransferase [bacterium]
MTQSLRISVIIPALNESQQIASTIESAKAAGFDEIIVVDGGSTDDTLAQSKDADIAMSSQPGRAIQQNAGAEVATGDVLFFLHADCQPNPKSAEAIRQVMAKDRSVIAGAFRQHIDARGWRYRWLEWGNRQRVRWFGMAYGDQGLFIRRPVFENLSRFAPLPLMEDVDLMVRLRGLGTFVLLEPELIVSARRWQKRGVFRQTLRNWSLLLAYFCGVSPERLARFYRHVR